MRHRFVNLRIPETGNDVRAAELLVEDGRFVAVEPTGSPLASDDEERVDLGGALVLPGVIDGHVHFDDPGFTHREDFETGWIAESPAKIRRIAQYFLAHHGHAEFPGVRCNLQKVRKLVRTAVTCGWSIWCSVTCFKYGTSDANNEKSINPCQLELSLSHAWFVSICFNKPCAKKIWPGTHSGITPRSNTTPFSSNSRTCKATCGCHFKAQ